VGVLLLAGGSTGASLVGIGFALAAASSVAVSIFVARQVSHQTDALDGLTLSVSVAALLTLPIGVRAMFPAAGLHSLVIVAAVGVLAIALPYALEFTALRRVGVKTYSILLSLDPAIAAVVALVILGQHLSLPEFGGIGLVVSASAGAVATGRVS
jgi:inner membrane transporter RhtA